MSGDERAAPVDARVVVLRTGAVQTQHWGNRPLDTAAVKAPHLDPVYLTVTGFEGDEQGDRKHHGGPEKAVCCYPGENYEAWRADGFELPVGAFFENLTLRGAPESLVFLGDVFEIGTALVQVTQPRRPCTTVSKRWQSRQLPQLMQRTGRCGYYLRVLREGRVTAGDPVRFVRRLPGAVSVAEVNRVMNVDRDDAAGMRRLLAAPELPAKWRAQLRRRLGGEFEDESQRLGTTEQPPQHPLGASVPPPGARPRPRGKTARPERGAGPGPHPVPRGDDR